ncbi:hypothetical protein D3C80_1316500 [compost metagenome]
MTGRFFFAFADHTACMVCEQQGDRPCRVLPGNIHLVFCAGLVGRVQVVRQQAVFKDAVQAIAQVASLPFITVSA